MPLVHIVLCKVKPEILDSSSHFSDFQEGCRTLETMPSLKPLLLECAWSRPSYEDRAKGWNWGENLRAFKNHAGMVSLARLTLFLTRKISLLSANRPVYQV